MYFREDGLCKEFLIENIFKTSFQIHYTPQPLAIKFLMDRLPLLSEGNFSAPFPCSSSAVLLRNDGIVWQSA